MFVQANSLVYEILDLKKLLNKLKPKMNMDMVENYVKIIQTENKLQNTANENKWKQIVEK